MKTQHKSQKHKPNWWEKFQRSVKRFVAGKNALDEAIRRGNLKEVESLTKNGDYDVNSYNDFGYPPLHHSLRCDQYEIMLWLLNNPEVDLNQISNPKVENPNSQFNKPEKAIQPYLIVYFSNNPTSAEFTKQLNKSLIRVLVMHGLTEEGVTFYENHLEFKKLFFTMREVYKQKQEAEAKLVSGSLKEAYEACQYLEGVWRGLAQQEENTIAKFNHEKYLNLTLFKVLNTFYQEKAYSYAKQAKLYEAKLDDNISSTKLISAPTVNESQVVNYLHPANLITAVKRRDNIAESNHNIISEEMPLLSAEAEESESFILAKKFN